MLQETQDFELYAILNKSYDKEDNMGFYAVLGVVAWLVLALWPASIAKRKGYSFALFFVLAIFISFLLALIVAAMLRDKNETSEDKAADRAADRALEREEG